MKIMMEHGDKNVGMEWDRDDDNGVRVGTLCKSFIIIIRVRVRISLSTF